MKVGNLALVAALAGPLLLAGPLAAETVRWARSADALTLDPHANNDSPTRNLLQHIYDTLVLRGNDGKLEPRLATEWRVLPDDPTVWEFKLRQGVTFQEGQPLTADDVVFSLNRIRNEHSALKGLHKNVVEVVAVDDYTVQVKMDGPQPLYVQNLTNTFIMDHEWSEEHDVLEPQNYEAGESNYAVRHANGTGTYKLVERVPDVKTVLTYNPEFWGEKPAVDEVVFTPIKDNATRIAALLSGEVDVVQDVPVQDISRLENSPGFQVSVGPENRSIFFSYDLASDELETSDVKGKNPFKEPKVREAMSLAVDRDTIQRVVMRGNSDPAGMPLAPFANGWTEALNAYPAPDIAQAKELLAEGGYPDGFSVALHCPNDRYVNDEAICQAVVGMLAQIGIKINLIAQPRAQHFALIENWTTDFYLLGWGVPTFDSQYLFDFLVHTRDGSYGSYNGSRYSNPELDAKIEALATEADLEKRDAMIAEIWQFVQDERIFLTVHNQVLAYAMRDGLNLAIHPENQPNMATITLD